MNKIQMRMLSRVRRVRDFLLEHEVKSDVLELSALRQDDEETLGISARTRQQHIR